MFIPEMFRLSDPEDIRSIIDDYGFGYLISTAGPDAFPMITAIPMLYADGTLYGHVARPNPHAKLFDGMHPSRALFQGPHGYVSPTWYPSPEASVPTWNYVAAVAEGRPERVEDAETVQWILAETARQYEGNDGWSPSATKPGYIEGMMRGIVAFRMPVERLLGKAKLSQNKTQDVRDTVIRELDERGEAALAAAMRRDYS
ncbi:MAG: FMN-binding negative transcriptional regulator [Alphaproteobacteria bacterium]|nr:FMN-binding negative transcriptional regulator [Alphaproteobacteria bacterium]